MTRPIATRCGEPAHVDAPEPKKALIPMADWLAGHDAEEPTAWERFADIWRNSPAFERCLAVGLAAMTAATIAYSVWRSM